MQEGVCRSRNEEDPEAAWGKSSTQAKVLTHKPDPVSLSEEAEEDSICRARTHWRVVDECRRGTCLMQQVVTKKSIAAQEK